MLCPPAISEAGARRPNVLQIYGVSYFLPACTYVQRGSKNCFVFVVVLVGTLVRILQSAVYTKIVIFHHAFSILQCNLQFAICNFYFRFLFNFLITTNFDRIVQYSSKYCIIVQFHHAFSILHHCMLPCNAALPRKLCPAALPGILAQQPCPAALHGSLARQPCPAALTGSLARQPCPAALTSSLARQPCPAALPASLARQPCPPALPASLARQPCPPALQKSLQAVLRP
jgi:hypothetical protein